MKIKRAIRRDDTTTDFGGVGDNFHMTWASDDRQYVAVCDGAGWGPNLVWLHNSRLWTIEGGPQNANFSPVESYPLRPEGKPAYYGFGTLALDGHIYQYLSVADERGWKGTKLIYSPDQGRTWCNQDGTSPVIFEDKVLQSRDNMIFFDEPQRAFSLISLLQMGRGYEFNRDGYVYGYSPNGLVDGEINELVMFRVPRESIRSRVAYEYFAGHGRTGSGTWSKDINARRPVYVFTRGRGSKYSWMPSISYNAPLGLYLMASWGWNMKPTTVVGVARSLSVVTDPSYLGFWSAPNPWGPWTQFHEESTWLPGGDKAARAYQPQIAPKWISDDGKSFWLVWADYRGNVEFIPEIFGFYALHLDVPIAVKHQVYVAMHRKLLPEYKFHVQRVDLELG